jgi:prepilin-type N-terminal cleavage/methylation domain-containing protein
MSIRDGMSPNSQRRGFTLVEMLVALVIIAGMIGLLFPAIHAARESAHRTGCLNNLHQLRIALQLYVDANNDPPATNGWTVAILPWLEESATLTALQDGRRDVLRPAVFECPSHPEFDMIKPGIQTNLYAMVISRPERGRVGGFGIVDRAVDLTADELALWWIGPENLPSEWGAVQRRMTGPHRGGSFNSVWLRVSR